MDLRAATWTDVRDLETNLAVVPVGSTEQHGPTRHSEPTS